MVACPKLTELTVLCPHPYPRLHPHDTPGRDIEYLLETIEAARSAILELVNACKTLPDFDTFQIVHFSITTPPPTRLCWPWQCGGLGSYTEEQKQVLRELIQTVKDVAIDCLKELETGCQQGEGRTKTTLRIIELNSVLTDTPRRLSHGASPIFHLSSVKVEEYGVEGLDSNCP